MWGCVVPYECVVCCWGWAGPAEAGITHCLHPQEDQQGDGGHAPPDPLLQRDSPIVVVIDLFHHILQDLQEGQNVVIW